MRMPIAVVVALLLAGSAAAQKTVSFPTEDGSAVYADVYGEGDRGIVLAHGGRFNKESWEKQARTLASAGFRVLALDFRGYGKSRGPGQSDVLSAPLHLDVLAAVRYLRKTGAKSGSVVGGSMGGGAAGDASIASRPGDIDRLVLQGAAPNGPADTPQIRRMAPLRSSSRPACSSWQAKIQARMDHAFPGFRSNTRKLPSQKR